YISVCLFLFITMPIYLSFFFTHPAPTEIYTLSLHDALPISLHPRHRDAAPLPRRRRPAHPLADARAPAAAGARRRTRQGDRRPRSEEHTSELQSLRHLVCRLLLEKKKKTKQK